VDIFRLSVIFMAALAAGAINAIAGGGTVFSFTALAWAGLPLVRANATNAAALVPGSVGGAVALRRELIPQWRTLVILLAPTIAGSLFGAFTVANTPEAIFRAVVPFLVLFATVVFAARNRIISLAKRGALAGAPADHIAPAGLVVGGIVQFIIAFYGGYFGAGIGILMLTSLSLIGMSDVIKMNALKNALAVAINGTAATFFAFDQKIEWPVALLAAVAATLGGYVLARLARRINQNTLRAGIVVAGVIVSAWLFIRLLLT
jgi:uncharacterized protein